ncbi:MAG: DUF1761 domain-containing protein [Candidatus Marinimicrobia bacterium]|nr:DUF1761 domain-containing protein [Candidatus Neomarinimicrobiota bacterium]
MYEPVINYWAVLLSAVVFFAIGSLWYGPLFGNAWTKSIGWTKESLEADGFQPNMVKSFGIMFLGSLLMAFITAHMVDFMLQVYPEMSGLMVGLNAGFWLWLGYIFSYLLSAPAFENKPWSYVFINGGYWLVGILATGAIVGVWR